MADSTVSTDISVPIPEDVPVVDANLNWIVPYGLQPDEVPVPLVTSAPPPVTRFWTATDGLVSALSGWKTLDGR